MRTLTIVGLLGYKVWKKTSTSRETSLTSPSRYYSSATFLVNFLPTTFFPRPDRRFTYLPGSPSGALSVPAPLQPIPTRTLSLSGSSLESQRALTSPAPSSYYHHGTPNDNSLSEWQFYTLDPCCLELLVVSSALEYRPTWMDFGVSHHGDGCSSSREP